VPGLRVEDWTGQLALMNAVRLEKANRVDHSDRRFPLPMRATPDVVLRMRTPDYEFESCVFAYVLVGRDKGASSDSDLPRGSFAAIRPVVNFNASRMT